MQVNAYLLFDGRCEEALEYYRKAIGAEVVFMMRMKETPDAQQLDRLAPGSEEKIMHASFRVGDTTISASDGSPSGMGSFSGKPIFHGFQLTLTVANDAEAAQIFAALSDGGQVRQPLIKTFFSPRFGMVTDRFGIYWIVMVGQQ